MDRWLVVSIAALNAFISLGFAYGVKRQAASWHWPPSWLGVVAGWLITKSSFFIVSITVCWALGIVGFQDAVWWERLIYLVPLCLLVIGQGAAAFYWKTGRAVTDDALPEDGHD